MTGIHLDGNAASWWPHAEGRYERGHQPAPGAVLVFKPYSGMHVGHVAVVSRVVGPREILVDQANWVRGRVTKAMSVIDASPQNDWTSVKVQFAGTHGRANPTFGFIYPHAVEASLGETIVEPQPVEPIHPTKATLSADKSKADKHGHGETRQLVVKAKAPDRAKVTHTDVARSDIAKSDRVHRVAVAAPVHHKAKGTEAKVAYVVY